MLKFILLLALVLRLPLMFSSLWLDEAIEALALMGKFGPLLKYALADFQPPIYHFILSAWTSLAGYSELALRTPSLLAGLGLVYYAYKLTRLFTSRHFANFSALLVATNPLLIYYSAEGRTYMLTSFFVLASFYYLFLSIKSTSNKSLLAYFLFTLVSLWSSYLAWIIIAIQLFYFLKEKHWQLFQVNLLAFFSLVLWLPSFFQSLGIGISTLHSAPQWGGVVGGLSLKAIVLTWVKSVIGRISFANKQIYAFVIIAVLTLHTYILRHTRTSQPLLWLAPLSTLIIAIIIALFLPIYAYFRLLFLLPFYLILLSLGFTHLPKIYAYLLVSLNLVFISIFYLTPRFHHEDWRSLTQYLNQQTGSVALPSLNQSAPLIYYHLDLPLISLKNTSSFRDSPIFYIRYVEDIFDPQQQGRQNLLQHQYQLTNQSVYTGIQVDKYSL